MLRTWGWGQMGPPLACAVGRIGEGRERPGLTEPIPRVCVAAESVPRATHVKRGSAPHRDCSATNGSLVGLSLGTCFSCRCGTRRRRSSARQPSVGCKITWRAQTCVGLHISCTRIAETLNSETIVATARVRRETHDLETDWHGSGICRGLISNVVIDRQSGRALLPDKKGHAHEWHHPWCAELSSRRRFGF